MKKIQAIYFDIDGTLIGFDAKEMTKTMLNTLHRLRKKGIKLFLATGRPPLFIHNNLSNMSDFDGIVALNGSCVLIDDEMIRQEYLDPQDVALLRNYAVSCGETFLFVQSDKIFVSPPDHVQRIRLAKKGDPLETDLNKMDTDKVSQIIMFSGAEKSAELEQSLVHTRRLSFSATSADFIPETSGKGRGIEAVNTHFGFKTENTLAFGDAENDIPMFKAVGCAVAMGHALPDVKAQANDVTDSVENEGITQYLEKTGVLD